MSNREEYRTEGGIILLGGTAEALRQRRLDGVERMFALNRILPLDLEATHAISELSEKQRLKRYGCKDHKPNKEIETP